MDSSHRQVSSVDARGCRKTEGTEGRGLSDRLGVVRGYVVIRVRLTLHAESVATGTVAISLPSPQTCEGRERREPREPLGAALPSGPFQDPSSGSPTRIG